MTSSRMRMMSPLIACMVLAVLVTGGWAQQFKVGVGISDVTGPATEIPFMGYAFPGQTGRGIHTRLFSRAFVFEDKAGTRGVYVSMDLCMSMYGMKMEVIDRLSKLGFGAVYRHDNVLMSGIHTHSGPGAYSWFLLYDISMSGFDKKHFDAVVDGIVASIVAADADLKKRAAGPIHMLQGTLNNASANRSPSSYLVNPPEEQAEYVKWGGNVDTNMTVLNIVDGSSNTSSGAISIFAVHCTSMHNTNRLISSDNKGYASLLFEKKVNPEGTLPGRGPFVAAFGQSNLGDVSPNTQGAWCNGTVGGTYCSNNESLCNGRNELCFGVGPTTFADDEGSTKIIGERQFDAAWALFNDAPSKGEAVEGLVTTAFEWVNMYNLTVQPEFTNTHKQEQTCRPAVGFSFAAGTTDGPGAFNFYQGDNCTDCLPFWNIVKNFLKKPTPEQKACQFPKPILLDVGEIEPYPWTPLVVPIQIIKVGNFVFLGVPCEFTTMAGRRLRKTVEGVFAQYGQSVTVVIAGLSNGYSGYVATYEEYQVQRYEAASTLYGPHTLAAYQQEFTKLATAVATGKTVDPGHPLTNQTYVDFFLLPPVLLDTVPSGKQFGSVHIDALPQYKIGDTVNVTFWGANLRNHFLQNDTFMEVRLQDSASGTWVVKFTDASWETKVEWARSGTAESLISCTWTIPSDAATGQYSILHRGFAKKSLISEDLTPYSGVSSTFSVSA